MKKVMFYLVLYLINTFFKGTYLFNLKRKLLCFVGVKIGEGTNIVGPIYLNYTNHLSIGESCWIGKNFIIDGNGDVEIECNCDIAPNLTISTGGHEIGNHQRRAGKGKTYNTIIKNGTWIGTNVLILSGADIGKASIVAAGSVVTKDVIDNTMVAGVPAKRKRIL